METGENRSSGQAVPKSDGDFAVLRLPDGREARFPIIHGTEGQQVIDVRSLGKLGYYTYDPGSNSTASCLSSIAYTDVFNGEFLYRGYPVGRLVEKCSFMEVSYLLITGKLPTSDELEDFESRVMKHSADHDQMYNLFSAYRRDSDPMAILCGVCAAMASFYNAGPNPEDHESRMLTAIRLIAKLPTIAAMSYKYYKGQPFIAPDDSMTYTGNFLRMMFATPCEEYKVNPIIEHAIDRFFILLAEHGQNASTACVRFAAATGSKPFACFAAGVAALWGPSQAGESELALKMLEEIGSPAKVPEYVKRHKDPSDPFRLRGVGGHIYHCYDPRAEILRELCLEVLYSLGMRHNPVMETALELDREILNDSWFMKREEYPTVNLYAGILLRAAGIPFQLFPVIYAISRSAGWAANWMEFLEDSDRRIDRPRQLYTGNSPRHVRPIFDR